MFTENLAKPIHQALQKERGTLQAFEKNYHKRHGEILVSIKKAEKATKKSGKKSADQLQQVSIGVPPSCLPFHVSLIEVFFVIVGYPRFD